MTEPELQQANKLFKVIKDYKNLCSFREGFFAPDHEFGIVVVTRKGGNIVKTTILPPGLTDSILYVIKTELKHLESMFEAL